MIKRIAFIVLPLAALAACSESPRPFDMAFDQPCSAIASTGDMYRYCLEVGPQQALLDVDGTAAGTSQTASALAPDRRHRD